MPSATYYVQLPDCTSLLSTYFFTLLSGSVLPVRCAGAPAVAPPVNVTRGACASSRKISATWPAVCVYAWYWWWDEHEDTYVRVSSVRSDDCALWSLCCLAVESIVRDYFGLFVWACAFAIV